MGKKRSLVGDAKFERMVRRESRKALLNSALDSALEEEEEEQVEEEEAAKADEILLLDSLQDDPANSKVRQGVFRTTGPPRRSS
jgi:hypothetical protein